MDWLFLLHAAWHGLSAAVIACGGIIVALAHWPTRYEWLVIGISAAGAFVKGVEGFLREPKGAAA